MNITQLVREARDSYYNNLEETKRQFIDDKLGRLPDLIKQGSYTIEVELSLDDKEKYKFLNKIDFSDIYLENVSIDWYSGYGKFKACIHI